ncbi:MAG: MFS transporter [Candidatus Dadabacteria bacterium]
MLKASVQLYKNAYSGLSRQMWWLAIVILVNRSGTMVLPFLTVYLTHNGFSLQQAGYIMAAFGSGGIVGSFLGGKLTDKIGFHYVQVFSLLLNGVLFFVLGRMQTFTQLAVCIFVLSTLGESFRPANAAAIAAFSTEANRTRCYSLNRLAINIGWTIGPAIGGILASINYQLLFWVDGITCILASILLHLFLSPYNKRIQKEKRVFSSEYITAYSDKVFLKGMFFLFLIGTCFFQLFTMMPIYYKEQLHMNEASIGALLAVNGLIIAFVEMILVYKLEQKKDAIIYVIAGSILMGLSFIFLNTGTLRIIALVSIIMVTFGEMLLFPFINNFWVNRSKEQNRGQYASVYTLSFAMASIVAPTMGAQIAQHAGFSILWIVDFCICLLAGLGFLQLKKALI